MKKLAIIIAVGFIGIIAVMIVSVNIRAGEPYTKNILENWGVTLPGSYAEIYEVGTGASFQGDGDFYHVFKYKSEKEIKKSLTWEKEKNTSMESAVKTVLKRLNVSDKNMPDFRKKYQYYTQSKDNNSTLFVLYFNNMKKLYIIENIF